MNQPDRWMTSDHAPKGARELLATAMQPKPLAAAVKTRSAVQLAQAIGAHSVTPLGWVASHLLVKAAVVGVAGVLLATALSSRRSTSVDAPYVASARGPATATSVLEPVRLRNVAPAENRSASAGRETRVITPNAHATRSPAASSPRPLMLRSSTAADPTQNPSREVVTVSPAPPSIPAETPQVLSESDLLARAYANLDHDARATMRDLDMLSRAYPHGDLLEEREYLAIRALQRSGNQDAAIARANEFIERYSSSVYGARVRRILESSP